MGVEALIWGLIGGVASEVSGIYDLRRHDPSNWPHYMKLKSYWAVTAIMACIGAALAYAYSRSGIAVRPILAINVGASAPLILRQLKRTTPRPGPGSVN
jgi:hypothetical protein